MELIPVGLLGSIIVGANFALNKKQKETIITVASIASEKVKNAVESFQGIVNNQNFDYGKENIVNKTTKKQSYRYTPPDIVTNEPHKPIKLPKKREKSTYETPTININNLKPITVDNGKEWKTEKLCRSILETLYKIPFPKDSEYVKNPETGKWLELDGYNREYKIAYEYQGEQHYIFPHEFWKNRKTGKCGKAERINFLKSIRRDKYKAEKCDTHNIALIIIPYTEHKNLTTYIPRVAPRIIDGKRESLVAWKKRLLAMTKNEKK